MRPLRARLYRPGGHGVVQSRRQHERRDTIGGAVLDLSQQVQPVSVWQCHVDQRGVQSTVAKEKIEARKQQAKKKVGAESTQAEKEIKKKVEARQQDLEKKVDDLKKKAQTGQEDLKKKVDDVHKDVNDLQEKIDKLLKKVDRAASDGECPMAT